MAGINWVIVGGESGPGARKLDESWVRSLRDQCIAASVPFFFKQWGGVRKNQTGRVLDGQTHNEFPTYVKNQNAYTDAERKTLVTEISELSTITWDEPELVSMEK